MDTIKKIADFFNVTQAYLLGESDLGFIITYETDHGGGGKLITENELDYIKGLGDLEETLTYTGIYHQVKGRSAERYLDEEDDGNIVKSNHFAELSKESKGIVNDMIEMLYKKEKNL